MDKIINKKILLIDDIYTTGATLNECSKILKQAGAEKVDVFTIAKDSLLTEFILNLQKEWSIFL